MARDPIKLAVFISGAGGTLANLVDKITAGALHARIVAVVCSSPESQCEVTEKVGKKLRDAKVPPLQVIHRKPFGADVNRFSDAMFLAARDAGADLVCLAGFLCLLRIPKDFTHKVLNIHPALLPSFGGQGMYGRNVHEAVLNHGCKVSGCTVHFADQTYDTGPILVQKCCPVRSDDTPLTLAKRVFELECEAYPEAIELLAEGRVKVVGRVAKITDR